MNDKLVLKVRKYITEHQLLNESQRYIVALSGGADSVCLLLVLKELGFHVDAVHCNFHLRGEESDRDEAFCMHICQELNIHLHRVHFDTNEYASLYHLSIEMAARELRYKYFEQLRRDIGAAGICVAHHRDDSVETLLINLIRGTGIHGLTGIMPVNGKIIRPLLCVSREEIVEYLALRHQKYVIDSTNMQDTFVRNKIRLKVLPLMREINPSVSENITQTAERINEAVKVFDEAISQKSNEAIISKTDELVEVDIKQAFQNEYVLFNILSPYGFSSAQIEQIYHSDLSKIGNQWCSMNHVVTIDRTRLFIDKKIEERQPMRIPEEGIYVFSEKERVSVKLQVADESFQVNRNSSYACLDADKVQFPLYLRRATIGDRFVPFGMKGSKLVSDFLTDRKKTRHEKAKQLVVTDKTGNIVWLVNERPDNRFCITDDTRNVLILCLLP